MRPIGLLSHPNSYSTKLRCCFSVVGSQEGFWRSSASLHPLRCAHHGEGHACRGGAPGAQRGVVPGWTLQGLVFATLKMVIPLDFLSISFWSSGPFQKDFVSSAKVSGELKLGLDEPITGPARP